MLLNYMYPLQMKTRQLMRFRRRLVFRIIAKDQMAAELINLAADGVSKDLNCPIRWRIANGSTGHFDATLVLWPLPLPQTLKPCREVKIANISAKDAIAELTKAFRDCIIETECTV
jgi:hypothetical protein